MMATTGPLLRVSDQRKRWPAESCVAARSQEERQTVSVPEPRSRQPKPLRSCGSVAARDRLVPALPCGRG